MAGSRNNLMQNSLNTAVILHLFPTIQQIARTSFVNGTIDILIIAGCILAAGAVLSLILIRDKDMFHRQSEAVRERFIGATRCPTLPGGAWS